MKAASLARTAHGTDMGPKDTRKAGGRSVCLSPSDASGPTVPSHLSVDQLHLPSLLSSSPGLRLHSRSCLWCSVAFRVTATPPRQSHSHVLRVACPTSRPDRSIPRSITVPFPAVPPIGRRFIVACEILPFEPISYTSL